MSTVDNRVVQMRFDNKQFESGVQTSLGTLDKLKNSLNMDSATRSLSKLQDVGNSFSLSGISNSVDVIADKFSALGVIGTTVLQNLTNSAMDLARNITNALTAPIVEGGKTRALNIEQAKFQLEGLGVAWEEIKDDINYGVKDTAYGLDAAAKVASQLVASDIQIGESMKTSLRAVSGVAAMTSSSYEEIGHIFTTVAGNGKLMTLQLRELSNRGLNAAATLAKYLHVSEADLREMVTQGQIDFATFATAMDDAYGEHAKDANKTFTGALSNMKAALSRLGADVATPAFEDLKNVLNALIPVIDGVHESLKPLIDTINSGMDKVANFAVKAFGNFGKTEVKNFDELEEIAQRVMLGEFGNGEERRKKLEELGYVYEDVQAKVNALLGATSSSSESFNVLTGIVENLTKSLTNVGNGIISIANPIKEAFTEIFPPLTIEKVTEFTKRLENLTAKFKISDKSADKLKQTFKGLFSVLSFVKQAVSAVYRTISPLSPVLKDVGSAVLNSTARFGDYILALSKSTEKNDTFYKALQNVIGFIKKHFGKAKEKVQELVETFERVTGIDLRLPTLSDFLNVVELIKEKVAKLPNVFDNTKEKISNFITAFEEFTGIDLKFPTFEDFCTLLVKLKDTISEIPDKFVSFKDSVAEFFGSFKKEDTDNMGQTSTIVGTFASALDYLSEVLGEISPKAGEFFSAISDTFTKIDFDRMSKLVNIGMFVVLIHSINKLRSVISTIFSFGRFFYNLNGLLVGARGALTAFTNDIKANSLLKIAGAVALLTASLIALSMVKEEKLTSAMGAMMGMLIQFMVFLEYANFEVVGFKSGLGLVVMATAIVILAKAVSTMGKIPIEELNTGLLGMVGALAAISVAAKFLPSNLPALGAGLLITSVAMNLLYLALKNMGQIPLVEIGKGLLAMAGSLAAITVAARFLPKDLPLIALGVSSMGVALSVLAIALRLMGGIPAENILTGLLALVSTLAIVGISAKLLTPVILNLPLLAVGLIAMGTAIGILAISLRLMGSIPTEDITKALLTLISTFALIGIASVLLTPVIPTLIAFSGAMLVLGVGVLAASVGIAAAAAAISTAIAALTAGAVGLPLLISAIGGAIIALIQAVVAIVETVITSIDLLIPKLAEVGLHIVVSILQGIANNIEPIVEAGIAIILNLLKGLESHLYEITVVSLLIIVELINGIAEMTPELIEAGTNLIVKFINGMADGIRDNTDTLLSAVQNLLAAMVEFSISVLQQFVRNMPIIGNKLSDELENVKTAVREALAPESMQEIGSNAANATVDGINSVEEDAKEAGNNLGTSAKSGLASVFGDFGSVGTDFGMNFSSYLGDTSEMASFAGIGLGDSATGGLSSMLEDFSSLGTDFGTDFSSSLVGTNNLATEAAGSLGDSALNGLEIDFSDIGEFSGDTYSLGLLSMESDVQDSATSLTDSAVDNLNNANKQFQKSGTANGTYYANGISGEKNKAKTSGIKIAASGVSGANSKINDFREAGIFSGKGFVDGLGSMSGEAERAASSIANAALTSMRVTLGIHSPSKKFAEIGLFSIKGFANGLNKYMNVAAEASKAVGEQTRLSLKESLRKVSDILKGDMNFNPAIRPVVDLSDVTDGVEQMNGMFGSKSLYLGNLNGHLTSRNLDLLSGMLEEMQNSRAYDSAEVVSAIQELRGDVAYLGNAISKMQVIMDSGALVGSIAAPMDIALGQRMNHKGRGN